MILKWVVINRALTHTYPHSPTTNEKKITLTHTQPKKVTLTHTYPYSTKRRSHSSTLTHTRKKMVIPTHTHPQPPKKKVTPTQTQPSKGHKHPYLPTPTQKWSHQPTHNWKKEYHVSNTWHIREKYPFSQYSQVFLFLKKTDLLIFFYWILLK